MTLIFQYRNRGLPSGCSVTRMLISTKRRLLQVKEVSFLYLAGWPVRLAFLPSPLPVAVVLGQIGFIQPVSARAALTANA